MMLSSHRWGVLASLSVVAALAAACPPPPAGGDAGPEQVCAGGARVCDNDRLCGGGYCDKDGDGDDVAAADDQYGCCVQLVCDSNDDCEENEKCDFRRGICIPRDLCDPAAENGGRCDLDGDGTPETDCCTAGQLCEYTGGVPTCVDSPPSAAECFIAIGGRPIATGAGDTEENPGIAVAGQALRLAATATDADGKLVPHATFTWTGADATGAFTGTCAGPEVCEQTVTATSGDATCNGVITVYPAHTAGTHRVVAIDAVTGLPVVGALATATIAGALQQETTDDDGLAEFAAGEATDVSVFSNDHQWQTVIDPPEDLLIVTAPIPSGNDVAGIKGQFDFDAVHTVGDIKLGLSGTSISANITDLNFNNIIGEIADYNVEIEDVTDPGGQVVPLPSGLVLALGQEPIKGDYITFGNRGRNIAWALGGQVRLAEIGEIISSVAASDDVNVGNILGAVLPFFATFDHAVVSGGALDHLTASARPCNDDDDCNDGVCVSGHCAASGTGQPTENDEPIPYDQWSFPEQTIRPDTLLAQSAVYDMPDLPCTPGGYNAGSCSAVVADGSAYQSGAVLLTGVMVPGIGLVPLGLTAGLDDPDDQDTNDQRDGKLDYTGDNAPDTGTALIDYAPPHDGLEGHPFVTLAIAIDIDALTDSGGDFGASVLLHVTPKYADTNEFAGEFLESQGGTFTAGAAGSFALAAKGAADFYSVNVDNGGDTEWNVWFTDDATTFAPGDFHPDPAVAAARFQHADVQAYRLGNGYAGVPVPTTFDQLFTFNGTNFDNMLYYMGAWSSESCKDNGVCDSTP